MGTFKNTEAKGIPFLLSFVLGKDIYVSRPLNGLLFELKSRESGKNPNVSL